MIETMKVILVSIFQGIAEFLPISSSGHLVLLGKIFNFDPEANFRLSIVLHFGTLCSIALYYMKDLWSILVKKDWRFILILIVASIPAGIFGVTLKILKINSDVFCNLALVGTGFIITGILLLQLSKEQKNNDGTFDLQQLSFKSAFLIGLAQMVAILPGISRSGSTIFAGISCKLNAKASAKLSFLMALIAIGGATFLEFLSVLKNGANAGDFSASLYLTGFIFSAASGYVALSVLMKILEKGKLSIFSIYLFLIGIATLIYYFMGKI